MITCIRTPFGNRLLKNNMDNDLRMNHIRNLVRKEPETKIRSDANDNLFDTNRHALEPETKSDTRKPSSSPSSLSFHFTKNQPSHANLLTLCGLYRLSFGDGKELAN